MPNQDKLIKQGIKYTDQLFSEISKRLEKGVRSTDTLESFLAFYHDVFPEKDNPLIALGYDRKMLDIILAETNNHKFSRPAQKELVRVTVENKVGDLIADVGEDVKESVREIVKDGYNNNLSQDEIAENISNRVSVIKNRRARAIARTEIARTAVVSDYIINREMGATHFYVECRNTACPVCKKAWHEKWTEENDDTFKPSDTSAGGKGWIGDRTFSMNDVGDLPPKHPNCRCVPYFITESEMPKGAVLVSETMTTTTRQQLSDDFLQSRLSEQDYKDYRMAKSNREFSQMLLDGGNLDERGKQLHTQSVENYTKLIEELEQKALSDLSKNKSAELKSLEENNNYRLNNRENSFSNVAITKEQFDKVVEHQLKRENAQLEWGNSIDNETGQLIHDKDIRGKKHKVFIPRHNKPYSIIHNHTNNNGFSGGDGFGHTESHLLEVTYATTPKGIWIMRDTEFGKFRKQSSVDGDYEIQIAMNSKYRKLADNAKTKYQKQYDNAKSSKEKQKIQRQMADEVTENYNNWLLDEYAVGKNRANVIEIEFIPIEELDNVEF